ncbi:MAG: hypothetical protein ACTHNY_01105 [Solirubrobacterales bacterium]
MRRGLLLALFLLAALPASALAETCPSYEGAYMFTTIHSAQDPEDYCWEVTLYEGQHLQQVDDQEIDVISKTGAVAWTINAEPAHDAEGADVPTTIALTGENEFVLTVHHKAGNPAAGGAPFAYPVTQGEGWEGGIREPVMIQGPPDEAELREAEERAKAAPRAEEPPIPTCEVPILQGRTVKAARRALLLAGCQLGPVRGRRRRGARIVKQYRPAFAVLPAGTAVGVRLPR